MFETFTTWDESYTTKCVQQFCLDNGIVEDPIYKNYVENEGMQNIMTE